MKKNYVANILQRIREIFLCENNCKYNSHKFGYKSVFIPFLSFCRNQKQEPNFQQAGSLVTRNIFCFLFVASCVLPWRYNTKLHDSTSKGMPSSIDLYERIFLCHSCSYYSFILGMIMYDPFSAKAKKCCWEVAIKNPLFLTAFC